MLHDLSVGTDAQASGAGIDKLNPLDLESQCLLNKSDLAAQSHNTGHKKDIIASAH
jgi:hypothetical protein